MKKIDIEKLLYEDIDERAANRILNKIKDSISKKDFVGLLRDHSYDLRDSPLAIVPKMKGV